jgi:hypothetical protein
MAFAAPQDFNDFVKNQAEFAVGGYTDVETAYAAWTVHRDIVIEHEEFPRHWNEHLFRRYVRANMNALFQMSVLMHRNPHFSRFGLPTFVYEPDLLANIRAGEEMYSFPGLENPPGLVGNSLFVEFTIMNRGVYDIPVVLQGMLHAIRDRGLFAVPDQWVHMAFQMEDNFNEEGWVSLRRQRFNQITVADILHVFENLYNPPLLDGTIVTLRFSREVAVGDEEEDWDVEGVVKECPGYSICLDIHKGLWRVPKATSKEMAKRGAGLCGQRALAYFLANTRKRRRMTLERAFTEGVVREFIAKTGLKKSMTSDDFEDWITQNPKYRICFWNVLKCLDPERGIIQGTRYQKVNADVDPCTIHLLIDQQNHHVAFIEHIKLFHRPRKYCSRCTSTMCTRQFLDHKCVMKFCADCRTYFSDEDAYNNHRNSKKSGDPKNCLKCSRLFPTKACRDKHMARNCTGTSIYCPHCEEVLTHFDAPHGCPYYKCHCCKKVVRRGELHTCYIQNVPFDDDTRDPPGIYAWDIESMLLNEKICLRKNDLGTTDVWRHVPNYVAVRNIDGVVTTEFEGEDCLKNFIYWAMASDRKGCVFYAHNLKGYDGQLLLEELTKIPKGPLSIVLVGKKIMKMKLGKITFLDSLNHWSIPLASVKQMWGLDESQFTKGYFPYLFNTPANQDYIGEIPDQSFFAADRMRKNERVAFDAWWNEKRDNNYVYDFAKELKFYCIQDVNILAQGLVAYRKLAVEKTLINPLIRTTAASFAQAVYLTETFYKGDIPMLTPEQDSYGRLALRGGRTDARAIYRKWTETQIRERIGGRYVDFNSMYPFVMAFRDMPSGAVKEVYCADNKHFANSHNQPKPLDQLLDMFGIITVSGHYTRYCHHPPLPFVHDEKYTELPEECRGKLLASLLPVKEETFYIFEVKNAVLQGFVVDTVHAYLITDKSQNQFKDYVATFWKEKTLNGGLPSFHNNPEEWNAYLLRAKEELGVDLDEDEFTKNPGLKSFSKLMLNSLWGKFAQANRGNTEMMDGDQLDEWTVRLENGEVEECGPVRLWDMGNGVMKAQVKVKEKINHLLLSKTNVVLAGCVSAQGRQLLLRDMNTLDRRVIYHDTDSLIYEYNPGLPSLPEGNFLGDLESETGGHLIHEFVSIGPKSYAYKYYVPAKLDKVKQELGQLYPTTPMIEWTPLERSLVLDYLYVYDPLKGAYQWWLDMPCQEITCFKAKGFRVTGVSESILCFDTMKKLALHMLEPGLVNGDTLGDVEITEQRFFVRRGSMYTADFQKKMKATLNKGILKGLTYYPFGSEKDFPSPIKRRREEEKAGHYY